MSDKPLDDSVLIAAARDGAAVSAATVRVMASELLQQRRMDRLDSRRAGQIKKLRSTVESMTASIIVKLDEIQRNATPEELSQREPPWLADAAQALGEVAPNGTPLALNWTQVIRLIVELRIERDKLRDREQNRRDIDEAHDD